MTERCNIDDSTANYFSVAGNSKFEWRRDGTPKANTLISLLTNKLAS